MAAFFGCRPCTMFDTRVKLDNPKNEDLGKPAKPATVLVMERADIGKQYAGDVSMDSIYDTKGSGDDVVIVT